MTYSEVPETIPDDDQDFRIHRMARISTRLGIFTMGLAIFGACSFGASMLLAVPISAFGAYAGFLSHRECVPKTATHAYSKVGIITNLTAGIISLISTVLVTFYFGAFCCIPILTF